MRPLLGILALLILACTSQPAAAYEYPWCAHYSGDDGAGVNCGFMSLEQCRWTVSGAGGFCAPNPVYAGATTTRPKKRKQSAN